MSEGTFLTLRHSLRIHEGVVKNSITQNDSKGYINLSRFSVIIMKTRLFKYIENFVQTTKQ